jgi:uncharacterized protein (DUF433 family)
MMDWRTRVAIEPLVCHGKASVRGTRIPVTVILDNLASGASAGEIPASYEGLAEEDIAAVLAYASALEGLS